MNRLILIGNGFDLAHQLKTGYNDFIQWYFRRCLEKAVSGTVSTDELLEVATSGYPMPNPLRDLDGYLDHFYQIGLSQTEQSQFRLSGWSNVYQNPFSVRIKSKFAYLLLQKCSFTSWVEIENEFYDCLVEILVASQEKKKDLDQLNASLKFVIGQLEEYLAEQRPTHLDSGYAEIFRMPFRKTDFVPELNISEQPDSTMILNFNYTDTVEHYFGTPRYGPPLSYTKVNYIHGKLNTSENPLIFGFGDELDENYRTMEREKTKGFLNFIKSFWYFRTSNYHDLLRFTKSGAYQIFILGHSCGLSDRTMLNMLFENENCKSIRIFYYKKGDYNNYDELTYEISRHFTDKVRMRQLIVSKDKSTPMPQIYLEGA